MDDNPFILLLWILYLRKGKATNTQSQLTQGEVDFCCLHNYTRRKHYNHKNQVYRAICYNRPLNLLYHYHLTSLWTL